MAFFNILNTFKYFKEIKRERIKRERNEYIKTHCIPKYIERTLTYHLKHLSDDGFLKWYDHWYHNDIPLMYFPDGSYAPLLNVVFAKHGVSDDVF